jgi:cholesterol oxidase
MVIEEGVIPGGMSTVLTHVFGLTAKLVGKDTDGGVAAYLRERARELASMIGGPYCGALNNTMPFLVMAHDDGKRELMLEDDRVRVRWPGVGTQPVFQPRH